MRSIKMRKRVCRKWTPVTAFSMACIPFSIDHKMTLLIRDTSGHKI